MITAEEIKKLISYNPLTGDFIWEVNRGGTAKIGSKAGSMETHGYIQIVIKRKPYLAHRLVFLFMEGRFPKNDVDHRNRIRADNSWGNLRHATRKQNTDDKTGSENYSGSQKIGNKFQAKISFRKNGKKITKHLGMFSTEAEAHEIYLKAKKIYSESIWN